MKDPQQIGHTTQPAQPAQPTNEPANQPTTEHTTESPSEPVQKKRRGFSVMSAEKQREIASKGGKASHEKGTGHQWSSEEAAIAGRKGGFARSKSRIAEEQERRSKK